VRVKENFESRGGDGMISIHEGETLKAEFRENGWVWVKRGDQEGNVPKSFLIVLHNCNSSKLLIEIHRQRRYLSKVFQMNWS
jgi:hypothetical protein